MSPPDLLIATLPVVEAFDRLGIAYMVGGSIASSAYGIARATLDVDLVAELHRRHAAPLSRLLADAYYVDQDMIAEAIEHRHCFNVVHLATMIKVDVYLVGDRPFDQASFERRRADSLEEDPDSPTIFLATPEDVVLHKLDWYRMGHGISERQWLDVQGVILVQSDALDRRYLDRWAQELGLADLLERAYREAQDHSIRPT